MHAPTPLPCSAPFPLPFSFRSATETMVAEQAVAEEKPCVQAPELKSNEPADFRQGLTLHEDGSASFRVWAPHAATCLIQIKDGLKEVHLDREGDHWSARLVPGALKKGSAYQ